MCISNSENPITLVFLDLETTGLNFESDEVIEIALVKTQNTEIIESYNTLIKPSRSIPRFITDLTGISKDDIEKAPRGDEIAEKVRSFIGKFPIIAHNASFDIGFLGKLLEIEIENPIFDTLEISRFFFPEFSSHSLKNLVNFLSLEKKEHHRALPDTLMLVELYKSILAEIKKLPENLLMRVNNITKDSKNFEIIFGKDWYKTGTKEQENFQLYKKSNEKLGLPFRYKEYEPSIFMEGNHIIETDSYEQIFTEIIKSLKHNKVLISLYSEKLQEEVINFFKRENIYVEVFNNPERYICPKKIEFFIENYSLIPKEHRINLATLLMYIYKTKDTSLDFAPAHIIKNPILRILSYCEDKKDCIYSSICSIQEKIKRVNDADVVICEHQFLLSNGIFNNIVRNRSVYFLESYRLPKVFYSLKFGFNAQDLKIIGEYEKIGEEKLNQIMSLFEKNDGLNEQENIVKSVNVIKNAFEGHENDLLKKFFEKENFIQNYKNGEKNIIGINKTPDLIFRKIANNAKNIIFSSKFNFIKEKNAIKQFVGIEQVKEISFRKEDYKEVLSIIPLFMHSPNYSEFTFELSSFVLKYHRDNAVLIFSGNNLLREVLYNLKSKITTNKNEDSERSVGNIDFMLYDEPISKEYSEIYLVKTPTIRSEYENYNEEIDIYSFLLQKNIVAEILAKPYKKSIVFYFDGRLKNKEFRNNYEGLFISFPIIVEREEVLWNLLESHRKKNA